MEVLSVIRVCRLRPLFVYPAASRPPCPAAFSLYPPLQTKKGAVSNYCVPILRCQRGLNSSLRSSDSAARGGQRSIGSK